FYVTRPDGIADADAGVEKIGAGVAVPFAGVQDFKRLAVGGAELLRVEAPPAPQEVEEGFAHGDEACVKSFRVLRGGKVSELESRFKDIVWEFAMGTFRYLCSSNF